MLKPIAIAALLTTFGAIGAYAQAPPPAAKPMPATTMTMEKGSPAGTDSRKLIGRNVKNMQGDTVGEIKSIYLDKDGKVDSVMVGVGGFLGVGEREVRMAWKDLNVSNNGETVTVNMTKDQLKAQPEYKYPKTEYRGTVFADTGVWNPNIAAQGAATSTGDYNVDGQMSTNAIIGASVKNANKDTVGKIEDAYIDDKGQIRLLVVSVGGFLGVGAKHVSVKWSDIKFMRDDKSVVLMTDWTKDSLKAMPDYKFERRMPNTRAGG